MAPSRNSRGIPFERRQVAEIASLKGGHNGSWLRFLNHSEKENNVEFNRVVVGQKNRLLAFALRNIMFGEELLFSYGENYYSEKTIKRELERDEEGDIEMEGVNHTRRCAKRQRRA